MNAGQKRIRQLVVRACEYEKSIYQYNLLIPPAFEPQNDICASCMRRLVHRSRQYATAAVAEAPSQSGAPTALPRPVQNDEPRKAYRLLISPVISRPPLLTRELAPFEESFYLYQKRLNERVALPLTRYFYYRKRTPAESEWKRKIKNRKTPARDIGVYSGYGPDSWNDEVLVGDTHAKRDDAIERLILDAEGRFTTTGLLVDKKAARAEAAAKAGEVVQKEEATNKVEERHIDRPSPRQTEADEKNDTKSLNRKLDRSLYLVVKNAAGSWQFPEDRMIENESLHQAAERIVVQSAGVNMNTWVLANHPSGHFMKNYLEPQLVELSSLNKSGETKTHKRMELGEKTFFMKTRIMAGQADIASNTLGVTDFQWLAKEEVAERVHPQYWSYIQNMLTER